MINILIPLGGKSQFFNSDEYPFPKPLIEIGGKMMIELVIESFTGLKEDHRFIFVVQKGDCDSYHLDDTLRLLSDGQCEIVKLTQLTKGAACSALMAINHIDTEDALIIANGDQIIDEDINEIVSFMKQNGSDAGVVSFESVHPKWSYVRLDDKGNVVETAEKRPLSKNAIAGFYYFKHGRDFIRAAMKSIENDSNVAGLYFIAPTLNELVLDNKKLSAYQIDKSRYHSFYSPQKVKEFEAVLYDREVRRASR